MKGYALNPGSSGRYTPKIRINCNLTGYFDDIRAGADVAAPMRRIFPGIDYAASAADALKGADACLVMTEWLEFAGLNGEFDLMKSRVVIEGRRILSCDGKEGICW